MAIIRVTFSCYYDYDVEVDNELYEEDPEAAEDEAIEKAYDKFCAMRRTPVADCTYDEVEVEVQ
jgi:hypothetical protein